MNMNEILGYINNFVEHGNTKVIIIANESEIATTRIVMNKELKYMVASNKEIAFTLDKGKEEADSSFGYKKSSNNTLDIKKLEERVNALFGEDKLYKQIKEKLIGVTIYYKPDISKVMDHIVQENIQDNNIREVVLNNKSFIIEKLDYYNHHNIRTLLFCLDKFNKMAEDMIKDISYETVKSVLNDILKYTTVISILYKTGNKLPVWTEGKEIDDISVGENMFNLKSHFTGFKFVDDFVCGAYFTRDKAKKIVRNYIEIKKSQEVDTSDPLYRLNNNCWHMEDGEALELLTAVNKLLIDEPKRYKPANYSQILYYNIVFNRLKVTATDVLGVVESMNNNVMLFEISKGYDTFGWIGSSLGEENDQKLFDEYIKLLREHLETYQQMDNINTLNSIFDNFETWTVELNNYVIKYDYAILSQKGFLSKMDFGKLLSALKQSSSKQITDFRSEVTHGVYKFSNIKEFYQADKEVIGKLISELTAYKVEIDDKMKMKANNVKYLIKDLESIFSRL